MSTFYFSQEAVVFLCEFVLASAIAAYLFSVKQKSGATWWLAVSMGAFALFFAMLVVITSTSTSTGSAAGTVVNVVQLFFFLVALAAALAFAYYFNGNEHPRESTWLIASAAAVSVLWPVYLGATIAAGWDPPGRAFGIGIALSVLLVTLWTLIVHLRKAVRFGAGGEEGRLQAILFPIDRRARAHRAFALLSLVILGVAVLIGLGTTGVLEHTAINTILLVCFMAYVFSVAIIYVNHAPEPTTFQVKIVSFALATVVTVLGITTLLVYDHVDLLRAQNIELPRASVDFTPDDGGYAVTERDAMLEDEVGGAIAIENGDFIPAAIGFEFPYAGAMWDSLYVDDDGFVSFGGGFSFLSQMRTTELPVIAPFYAPLHPERGGGVHLRRGSGELLVTWRDVPHTIAGDPVTVQLRLDSTGTIGFRYGVIPATAVETERGLFPSGRVGDPPRLEAAADMPASIAAGSGFVQIYGDDHRAFIHDRVMVMVWILLGSTLFVLVGFPFLLRSSITRPLGNLLEGMRRVNAGDLNTKVRIPVRDELGYLAQHFNQMTESLQKAEERLRAHAQELEVRVDERTAELKRSLDELKSMQAQLVQQEKLASLGALTAGIAHEIKNPLNFVNNFAALSVELADELAEEIARVEDRLAADDAGEFQAILDDLKMNAEKIAEHGKRADGIVKSMLLHSRGKSGERLETDLNALLNEYVNLAFHGMRAQDSQFNCDIERDYDDAVGSIEVVPQDVGRVFINLLNNAFYAVAEKAKNMNGTYAPVVRVSTQRVDDRVEIVVHDNGPGIPKSVRNKIFEPFFTTKPTGSGTGLGLSLSHEIVTREHGGTMRVDSEEGEATTFTISLPLRRNGAQTSTPSLTQS